MTLCEHGCGTELHPQSSKLFPCEGNLDAHTPERCQKATRALLDEARRATAAALEMHGEKCVVFCEAAEVAEKRAAEAKQERDRVLKRCDELSHACDGHDNRAHAELLRAEQLRAGKCLGTIPDTFIACGEGGNYCSEACRLRAALEDIRNWVIPPDRGLETHIMERCDSALAAPADAPKTSPEKQDPKDSRKLIAALYVRLGRARGALYDTELGYEERRAIADSTAIDVEVTDEEWDAAKAALDV